MQINNAVLVSLNISSWSANRQDRKISEEVVAAKEVKDAKLGRFWKSLFPKNEALQRVRAAERAARTFHYDNTHAWTYDGPRILPTANYDAYMQKMREFRMQFDAAVLEFIRQYPDLQKEAELVLGKLYKASDYPDANWVKSRYRFDLSFQTMPVSTGLLELGLDPTEAEELRQSMEADIKKTFEAANRRMWEDLYQRLDMLRSKLHDEKSYVREETIAAVRNLAELLPRLNITNDSRLDMLASRLKDSLQGVSANGVKNDAGVRAKAAADAQAVFNVMQSFMGAGAKASPALGVELKRAA